MPSDDFICVLPPYDDGDNTSARDSGTAGGGLSASFASGSLNQALVTFELMQAPDRRHQH